MERLVADRARRGTRSPPSGRTLGGVSMREQYAALENTEAILQEKAARLRESAEKKRRSYRSLGALTGAMIAVILF